MGSVTDSVKCKACGHPHAYTEFWYKTGEETVFCEKCGYRRELMMRRNEDGEPLYECKSCGKEAMKKKSTKYSAWQDKGITAGLFEYDENTDTVWQKDGAGDALEEWAETNPLPADEECWVCAECGAPLDDRAFILDKTETFGRGTATLYGPNGNSIIYTIPADDEDRGKFMQWLEKVRASPDDGWPDTVEVSEWDGKTMHDETAE